MIEKINKDSRGRLGGLDKRFRYSSKRKHKSKCNYNKLNKVFDSENSLSSLNTNKSNSTYSDS